jgi:3-deoxy-D-manno-octulosonic acid hydroxylase-like protein
MTETQPAASAYVEELPQASWTGPFERDLQQRAVCAMESGRVVFFPNLRFELSGDEAAFLTPAIMRKSKNVSFDIVTGELRGTNCEGEAAERLKKVMARFAEQTKRLVEELMPAYKAGLARARTSLRPVEVEGRATSWRKDDTRLHVDAFPTTPSRGKRIIRVFSNVNPQGRPRVWRVGEPFENLAKRFFHTLKRPFPGSLQVMNLLHITRGLRPEYDHFMLQLHDNMKFDMKYQEDVPQLRQPWPAGSTWMCFTDSVSHAAVTGQHQFEQTFYVPVSSMVNQEASPLRVLERLAGRKLA